MNKIEDSLKGGYGGLYGEVVTYDCYNITKLDFVPDLVYDIGANVGVFTRFARSLWPEAQIISVEPHPENIEVFKQFTPMYKITLIEAALGQGQLWHNIGAPNGAHESYVSSGLGFDDAAMDLATNTEKSVIPTLTLAQIVGATLKENVKSVIKIDVEGAENVIWGDKKSMAVLAKADYICLETHFYALHGGEPMEQVRDRTLEAFDKIRETHTVEFTHPYFQARKK